MLRTAVLGAGRWGKNLVRALAATPRVDVALVVDPSESARRRAEASGYRTASEANVALEDPSIEAVVIASPASTHARLALAALEAGKHVLVEKPLCLSLHEGEALRVAAARSRRVVMVGHLMRYHPGIEKLAELMRGGELGATRYLYATRVNLGTVRANENAWWSLAPHDVSVFLALLGRLPLRVSARGAAYVNPDVEDVVFAHLEFSGGVIGAIHVSWLDPHKRRQLTIVGERRMATFDDVEPSEKVRVFDVAPAIDNDFDSFAELTLLRHGDIAIPRLAPVEPLAAELAHFVECVLEHRAPLTGIEEGLAVVRVLEAGQRSLEAGGAAVTLVDG
jgi:predicted dehydrogenase